MSFLVETLKKQRDFVNRVADCEHIGKLNLWFSWIKCFIRYGATPSDWYCYELYKYRHGTLRKFITRRKNIELDRMFNPRQYSEDFDNKLKFNRVYSAFVQRKWFYYPETQVAEIQQYKWGG